MLRSEVQGDAAETSGLGAEAASKILAKSSLARRVMSGTTNAPLGQAANAQAQPLTDGLGGEGESHGGSRAVLQGALKRN